VKFSPEGPAHVIFTQLYLILVVTVDLIEQRRNSVKVCVYLTGLFSLQRYLLHILVNRPTQ